MNYIQYDEKDIQSFEYETTMVSDSNIIGTCELGKAEIQMLNDSNEYSSLKESWIETVHGSFYIYDVAPVQERVNIKLSCYDIKYKLDKPYDNSKHTFPCKLKEWRNSIFNDCEVIYDDSDFPNSELLLKEEPYIENGASNRQVMKMIAQAGASAVVTDENDCFYFKWFEDVIHTVEDWTELTTEKEASKPVNTIVLGRGSTEDNVYYPEEEPSEKVEFRIDNNYILDPQDVTSTEDRRYQTRIPIYEQVNGFSYLIFSMRTQNIENKLSVKLGQKVRYLDIYDNELEAYIMTKKITYLGGNMLDDDNYEISLSAEKIKETSTDLSYASSIVNDIMRVERKADKNAGVIEDTIEKQNTQQNQITQISQTVDTIQQLVSGEYGMDREVSGTNQIFIEDAMKYYPLELKIKGYSNLSGLIYPSENLFPSENLYPLAYHEQSLSTITLCIDSQDREHPTENLKEYPVTIEEPLRSLGTVKDELLITVTTEGELQAQITRYLRYTGEQIVKLDKLTTETITCPEIELLEHTNYVYIKEQPNYQVYVKYLIYSTLNNFYATRVELATSRKQTEDSIIDTVSATYSTKKEVAQERSERIQTVNAITQEVSTKANDSEIKSLITQKTNEITSNVSETYATKGELTTTQSTIQQTTDSISTEVSKKVGNNEVISRINQSTEAITILANKLGITANDILNIIAGNEINLTTKNISIVANNFSVDKTGKMKATSGEIGGYEIGTEKLSAKIVPPYNYTSADVNKVWQSIMGQVTLTNAEKTKYDLNGDGQITAVDYVMMVKLVNTNTNSNNPGHIYINSKDGLDTISLYAGNGTRMAKIGLADSYFEQLNANNASITNLTTDNFTNNSDERLKKDIVELDDKYLKLLDEINPVSFSYKETGSKHIGFIAQDVIKAFENNDLPKIPVSKNELGFYSLSYLDFIGILWKINQNMQLEIETLKQEIEVLKSER